MTKRITALFIAILLAAAYLPAAAAPDGNEVLSGLDLSEIAGGQNLTALTASFRLPLSVGDTQLTWSSSDPTAILIAGPNALVQKNAGSRPLVLTVSADGGSATRDFEVAVAAAVYTGTPGYYEDFEDTPEGSVPERVCRSLAGQTGLGDDAFSADEMIGVVHDGATKALQIKTVSGAKQYAFVSFDAPTDGETVIEYKVKPVDVTGLANLWLLEAGSPNNTDGNQYVRINQGKSKIGINDIPVRQGEWNTITVSGRVSPRPSAANKLDVYVDGALKAANAATQKDNGSHFKKMVIGHDANNIELWIDEIKVYAHPATAVLDQITTGAPDPGEVTGNLTLSGQIGGADITWYSSDETVISADGTVVRPAEGEKPVEVMLYALAEKDGYGKVKEIPLTVLPENKVSEALEALDINKIIGSGQTVSTITKGFTLPGTANGLEVAWTSSNSGVLKVEGQKAVVTRGGTDTPVTLTASVTNGALTLTKDFALTVLEDSTPGDALNALDINEIIGAGQTPSALEKSFALPVDSNGLLLDWTSSDPAVLSIKKGAASVFRFPCDKPVRLTAAVTYQGVEKTRGFDLTVKASEAEPGFSQEEVETIVGQPLDAVSKAFLLPAFTASGQEVIWTVSDRNILFIGDGTAFPLGNNDASAVTLTANVRTGDSYTAQPVSLTVAPVENGRDYVMSEDFEGVEVGTLPGTLLQDGTTKMWQPDSTISEGMKAVQYWVEKQGSISEAKPTQGKTDPDNKVLYVGSPEKGIANGMVHLLLDFPLEGQVALEYNILAPSSNYGHLWPSGTKNNALGGAVIVRSPMRKSDITFQDGDGSVGVNLNGSEWNKIRLEVNQSGKTYSAYVNGELKVENQKFRPEGTFLQKMPFGYASDTFGHYLVDDVSAWVDKTGTIKALAKTLVIENTDRVTKDLTLMSETITGGAKIQWFSDNPEYLSATGKVRRPAAEASDEKVTLSALVSRDGITALRDFNMVVKREMTTQECVDEDYAAVTLHTDGLLLDNLSLPQTGHFGTDILWTSTDETVIDPKTGRVTLKPYHNMQIDEVTLTAQVKKQGVESGIKTFVFRVPENNLALRGTISGSSDQASARYAFAADNDPSTVWRPAPDDKKPYLVVALPGTDQIPVTAAELRGSPGKVRVSYSKDGVNYTDLATGSKTSFNPVKARFVKFSFDGTDIGVSDLGIYYESSQDESAQLEADLVDLGNTKNLTRNISLPARSPNGYPLTWASSDVSVISDNGVIRRQKTTKAAVLTMTLDYNGVKAARPFDVSVLGTGNTTGTTGGSGGGGGRNTAYPAVPPAAPAEEPGQKTPRFQDVPTGHWAYEYIEAFAADGIADGVTAALFEPDRTVTREEFVKLLLKTLNRNSPGAKSSFTDVPETAWYYGAVSEAYALGIITGITDTAFGAGQPVTRQDMAVMIDRAAEYERGPAPQAAPDQTEVSAYAAAAVERLRSAGILGGYADGTIQPQGHATRAEAVTMLYRLRQKQTV